MAEGNQLRLVYVKGGTIDMTKANEIIGNKEPRHTMLNNYLVNKGVIVALTSDDDNARDMDVLLKLLRFSIIRANIYQGKRFDYDEIDKHIMLLDSFDKFNVTESYIVEQYIHHYFDVISHMTMIGWINYHITDLKSRKFKLETDRIKKKKTRRPLKRKIKNSPSVSNKNKSKFKRNVTV